MSNFDLNVEMPDRLSDGAWHGHVIFAQWIIQQLKPSVFVELGTHNGDSYFSFCQSVKKNNLTTKCHAIDSWQGEEHAGFYGEEVFDAVNKYNQENYSSFSTLHKCLFDEAVDSFENGSIDLLHIDGFHSYEAVSHDFNTWLPKLSANSVVLFHDTNEIKGGFGVWRLWDELAEKYSKTHFNFLHSHGLGVLGIGSTYSEALNKLFEAKGEEIKAYRDFFSTLTEVLIEPVEKKRSTLRNQYATIYVDSGSGLSEKEKGRVELNEMQGRIKFSLSNYRTIKQIRLDFGTAPVFLHLSNLVVKKADESTFIPIVNSGNYKKHIQIPSKDKDVAPEMLFLFNVEKPQLFMNFLNESYNSISFEYRIFGFHELTNYSLVRDLLLLKSGISKSAQQVEGLKKELDLSNNTISAKDKEIESLKKQLEQELKLSNNTLNLLKHNERNKLVSQYKKHLPGRLAGQLLQFCFHPFVYLRKRREILEVNHSGLFDDAYYLEQNPDLYLTTVNLLQHYMLYGWKEGRNPNPLFDAKYYLENNPDVKEAGVNPLLHYVLFGEKEGRKPNKDFDPRFYSANYTDVRNSSMNPLIHYILYGRAEGRASLINSKRDIKNLSENNNDLKQATLKDRDDKDLSIIVNSNYFNGEWYRLKYFKETEDEYFEPANHYLRIGWKEGKSPSKLFDGQKYLEMYCGVKEVKINPLLHYERYGRHEKRIILPYEKEFSIIKPNIIDIALKNIKRPDIRVSVIVNCNLGEELFNLNKLARAIDSILMQEYILCEIIIICNDINEIESFLTNNERLKDTLVITIDGKFLSKAKVYEKAIQNSSGNYISFCDVDCVWDSSYLNKKINVIRKYRNVSIVLNDVSFIDNFSDDFSNLRLDKIRNFFNTNIKKLDVIDTVKQNMLYSLSCCMIKSDVLKKVNFEISQACDIEWWIWIQITVYNAVYYINEPLVLMDQPKNNVSSNYHDVFLENALSLLYEKYPLKLEKGRMKINGDPFFSIIMATYNRDFIICKAIDSCLYQTYQNFELIIIDDGSTDNTKKLIYERFNRAIETGRIRYYKQSNAGVCKARNEGLSKARYDWIAYLDSDNVLEHDFLYSFANAIENNAQKYIFYSKFLLLPSNIEKGQAFDIEALQIKNFIDLGVFVHHKKLIEELGVFDISLTRLVDWDLIIRYTQKYEPVFIEEVLLNYNNYNNHERITNSIEHDENYKIIRKKNCGIKKSNVTTIITSYNHEKYISQAIESAIMQVGYYNHEIIISDDGSTDNTIEIINEYESRYPDLIRNISSKHNVGISANMKKCFERANGDYIAILEGDDYWSSKYKLNKQMSFLEDNIDCSMVFSMVKVKDEINGKEYVHTKQQELSKNKLIGFDLIKLSMNIIANFSSCMFLGSYIKTLPENLFENRISEIALAFYLENYGKIGFINEALSIYRVHLKGVWSGQNKLEQLQSGLECRETALNVCRQLYKSEITKIIEEYKKEIEFVQNGKDRFLSHEEYITKVKRLNNSYWNLSYKQRWSYMLPVLRELRSINPSSAIEIGTMGISLMKFSHSMNINSSCIDIDNQEKMYLFDARIIPWKIRDKAYDMFVALQVLEHMEPKQLEVFREIMRISRRAIITLPYKWSNVPENDVHYMVDENKINEWTGNYKPYKTEIFGSRIMLCYDFT